METRGGVPAISNADSDATPKPKGDEVTDRFSTLPIETIHKIMLLLPESETKEVRVLSKFFYCAYRSLPVLDIDFDSFPPEMKTGEKLLQFAVNLITYSDFHPTVFFERVSLRATSFPQYDPNGDSYGYITSTVDLLSDFALSRRARELIIDLPIYVSPILPESVLQCRSFRRLKLSGVDLLGLEGAEHGLVFDSPSLEVLSLADCNGRGDNIVIVVACPNLKAAEFLSCKGMARIEIEGPTAASLQSFSFKKFRPDFEPKEERCQIVNLKSCLLLRHLELDTLDATDERWLTDRVDISRFPELEALKLRDCIALRDVVALTPAKRLKTVALQGCDALVRVIIPGAANLESFQLSKTHIPSRTGTSTIEEQRGACEVDISRSKKIKHLVLKGTKYKGLTDEWVRSNIARSYGFSLLESLELEGCDLVSEIIFKSKKLKILAIRNFQRLRKMEIEAPNLAFFVYEGHVMESPVVIGSGNLDVEIKTNFPGYDYDNDYDYDYGYNYKLFRDFISYFGHCKTLTLVCISQLSIPMQLRDNLVSPLYDLQRLNIRLKNKVSDPMELIGSLLWLAPHVDTIYITVDSSIFAMLKFYFEDEEEEEDEDEDELVCCQFLAVKCWRHHLIKVEMEICEGFKRELDLKSFFMKNAKAILEITKRVAAPEDDDSSY